ncbi:MAG TPA: BTAD domain-containing putative transcriptional regulator, partial [Fimbriimonas sp.]|nr:BTAD domain-containing putative transcriptional regulator [Fimbriimonas sp.]
MSPAQPTFSPRLTMRLFGEAEIVVDGSNPVQLPSRRAVWLLGILALRNGQPIERQRLAGLIWPDSSDASALHNLRQTLAGIRRSLGSAADLLANAFPRSILLKTGPEFWVDVIAFDSLSKESSFSSMEAAVELYRGPLLAGCDEPYLLEEREAREREYASLVERLGSRFASAQDHRKAIDAFRRVIATDPYRESAVRALMSSLVQSGEAAAALELY